MCGIYHFDRGTWEDIVRVTSRVSQNCTLRPVGDIRPTDRGIVILGQDNELEIQDMIWGFRVPDHSAPIINARAETALQKRLFSDSVMRRRCIVPAKHFYEWDPDRTKHTFHWNESSSLYMAGFYNMMENEPRYVILTTAANEPMMPVHDRMPLILPENQIEDWILDDAMVRDILGQGSPVLADDAPYQQLSLF